MYFKYRLHETDYFYPFVCWGIALWQLTTRTRRDKFYVSMLFDDIDKFEGVTGSSAPDVAAVSPPTTSYGGHLPLRHFRTLSRLLPTTPSTTSNASRAPSAGGNWQPGKSCSCWTRIGLFAAKTVPVTSSEPRSALVTVSVRAALRLSQALRCHMMLFLAEISSFIRLV